MKTFPCIFTSLETLPQTSLMGEVSVPAPNKHFKRTPKEWILYAVSDGCMKIQEDTLQYHLTPGDILILSPGKCHFGLPTNDSVHYFYIHFNWKEMTELSLNSHEYQSQKMKIQEKIITQMGENPQPDLLLLPKHFHLEHHFFQKIMEDIRQLLHLSRRVLPHQQSMTNCLFFMLLLKLSRQEIRQSLPQTSRTASSTLPVIAYLKEHHREKITSRDLETHFHLNFDYMNRKFKENTGKTIFRFLEEYRIEESKKLLESQRFSIAEIAESLGFCNAFYFSKVFKKREHISPREYQQQDFMN